jgi:trehalose 6-phosphate phosphatase
VTDIPEPRTREGRAGMDALVRDPGRALVAVDFDGTLSPIVSDPRDARPHPRAVPALRRLAPVAGTVAVITGRPAADAAELGGFGAVPGLIVLGHYGLQRWQDGKLSSPPAAAGLAMVREKMPAVLAASDAPEGTWVEEKEHAIAVHTRRTADPSGALERLAGPLAELAASAGLACEPGRLVIELRSPGSDKGSALSSLVEERGSNATLFAGDDLGDLAAFAAVRALRESGHPGVTVCSSSAEVTRVAEEADLIVDGPDGVTSLLDVLATAMSA